MQNLKINQLSKTLATLHKLHSARVTLGISTITCSLGILFVPSVSLAATVTLELIDSYARQSPFGLAFDGTNIWWQSSGSTINQMTTSGVDTGITSTNPLGWSALAWSGTQLVSSSGTSVTYFDRITGDNVSTTTLSGLPGFGLIDGLDIGPGGEIWYSPDVSNVYRFTADGTAQIGSPTPFLGGAGGYSGVERVDVNSDTYIFVVNDASNPRQLCIHGLNAVEIGCTTIPNSRYEDLAFDGRYLWAADYFGGKIDKIDVKVDGGSIIDPDQKVPEPSSILGILVVGGLGLVAKRKKQR